VYSGHGTGKTHVMGGLVQWHFDHGAQLAVERRTETVPNGATRASMMAPRPVRRFLETPAAEPTFDYARKSTRVIFRRRVVASNGDNDPGGAQWALIQPSALGGG
jgi:hypothetical protein